MISRSRRNLCSFGGSDNAGINTSNSEWACKGKEWGEGKERHTGIGVKCLWWGEGVEGVVMMYGATNLYFGLWPGTILRSESGITNKQLSLSLLIF